MSINIEDVFSSIFLAMKNQGFIFSEDQYSLIQKEAAKIIESLVDLKTKEQKMKAKLSVIIPCNINQASIRNRTIRKFITQINPAILMEFKLVEKKLTLIESYDIFEGEIRSFPCDLSVSKKETGYSYDYTVD